MISMTNFLYKRAIVMFTMSTYVKAGGSSAIYNMVCYLFALFSLY